MMSHKKSFHAILGTIFLFVLSFAFTNHLLAQDSLSVKDLSEAPLFSADEPLIITIKSYLRVYKGERKGGPHLPQS